MWCLPAPFHGKPGLIIFGAGALCAFVKWEMRTKSPVFPVDLFTTNRVFAFSSLAAFINYSATFAITFLLSLYCSTSRTEPS